MIHIRKKVYPFLLAFCLLTAFVLNKCHVSAETSDLNQHIYDEAGLLSTTEVTELEKMCITYGEEAGIDIMILTHEDSNAPYIEDYIEDFEDTLPVGDRVYLGIDMVQRDVFMEGYGSAEVYIHSKRINTIIKEITPFLSDGDYYTAFSIYIERSAAYMKDDSVLNYDHNYSAEKPQSNDPKAPNYDATWPSNYNSGSEAPNPLMNVWVQLIIAVAVGAITVAIMAHNSGGRMTAGANNYLDQSRSGLIGRRDIYLRTTVTKVRKPQDSNNSNHNRGGFNAGGFRGGTSSGGRSHSSGGGKF